ncbi:MAG: dihydrolipoyl dehydrogenase [Candidatus Nanopelagicales bacterium]|nr:dihydrolipoyl dehydrogenase [Candidatus Nanopelagicales bacterium]
MADVREFDLVVLGGGSGGYSCAFRATQLGLSVALIEEAQLGGTCLHRGCIPTKALLHSAEVADVTRDAAKFGIEAELVGVNMPAVLRYKDAVIGRLHKGLEGLAKARRVELVRASGSVLDAQTVRAGGVDYRGRHLVLATGSFARGLPGIETSDRVITSDQALSLDYVPNRAIVLGGGVIGVEFASIWRSLGAEVRIVEALPRLIPAEDEACSRALERAFRKRGISTTTGAQVTAVRQSDAEVVVELANGHSLTGDVLLVAVGRGPRTSGIGLESLGVTLNRGFVVVDAHLQTSVPGVFAVGDIVPGLQLAHRSFAQGIYVAEHIAGLNPAPLDEDGIPRVTYSDPEVASVGLTELRAAERFDADQIETYEYNLGGNGKSQILGTAGFVKLVRRKGGPVVGVHLVGQRMGELIGEGQLIVNWEAEPMDVAHLIHAHPSQAEALGEAHLALAGKPLHVHD